MKEVIELYEYAKEKNEERQLFRILHHYKNTPKSLREVYDKTIEVAVFMALRRYDEKYVELLKNILQKITIDELKKALDILYCLDYNYDQQRIKLDLAMIYNEELKNTLIEKIREKDSEFAEKLIMICSIVEIEVDKEEILKVHESSHWFKKYGGIFVEGQIQDDKAKIKIMKVASNEFLVSVWNCQAKIMLAEGDKFIDFDEKYKDYDEEKYEELCNTVIYDDNDGAINWSGLYYPKSERSLKLFEELIQSAKEG